ncbi:hypothetical protein [Flavobacterium seoulense]|uniref:Uncharacterized protein n=1 Tax=Flavobacterium seoulense TaxID=1492738 RepID=A0A066WMH1_9FLAO|nr:hypothetical protein [Flavobacterium seoulense]KDN55056.1 hypothetical protein FEM21_16470 [Flavobacterium seoulense]
MNFNELIDFNLNLLNDGLDIRALELKNTDNEMLSDEKSLALFKKMNSESLIHTDNFGRIQLLIRAYEIIDLGGWLKYVSDNEKSRLDLENKNLIKENLELEILKLQKEAAEYQKSIRDKEDQIRSLTRDNLRLGNWDIRFRWYIAIISFIIGFIIKHFIENPKV